MVTTVAGGTVALGAGAAPSSANELKPANPVVAENQEQSRVIGTPTLTPQQQTDLAVKDAAAQATRLKVTELRAALESGATFTTSGDRVEAVLASCPDGDCSWGVVTRISQVIQSNSFYCGPAMLRSLVMGKISISQVTAANRLGTTSDGTDWYNGSYYPVEYALDYYLGPRGGANYVPINLPGSPTSTQKTEYKSRLYENTTRDWGTAGDAYEVVGGPHLKGHPNSNIFHWFAIRGYFDWGEQTNYTDSASGADSLSWGDNVPRYSTMSSDTIVTIMGGRGYIW